jgi:predicted DCC family thiol-disulfide oxidoreductase YuxK
MSIKITVFYDGKCGLCSKEINYYKKIAPLDVFDWQDITQDASSLNQENIQLSEGLKLLHTKDGLGKIHVGIDAFILIWNELDKWRHLAKIIALPGIRQIANFAYKSFTDWRFERLEHCQIALKEEQK